ncbi:alpha/beta hydrolase [Myxococcus sp. MISCRS1]|uniref:alpha/beta fold hydrolase n=1 Tax=Myxococcus TaxID=32 RepID=UPI001CBE5E5E|nr:MULTISPECIES: alpha/beta hydrolase [unclassified Myxococcus]MBZ4396536.1 alpha/beta hydrolase [Myxococcus sp. AS-1-15]MBZ4411757.1 alpha/beta hydrolase [Myxococcus sp. XM-1-1-1]MCY1000411.1 alpha/beta hydrolase [Myxococcus sp. MISCRS1]BDT38049.1 alpha/beta hydrolase [Myxococcus sp. MH1]
MNTAFSNRTSGVQVREGSLRLKDGRRLAYVESGDLDGVPVFFIHGNPGSRYMRHPDDRITHGLGVRLITPDRPGYGLSDHQPGRTLLDFPSDLEQLANALGIGRFSLFGVSAGGPYAAVSTWHLDDRILRAAIVSGASPLKRPGGMEGVNRDYRNAYAMAAWPEWVLHPLLAMHDRQVRANPDRALAAVMAHASPDDRRVLSDPLIAAQVQGWRREATRKGVAGIRREAHILASPWDFPLEEIRRDVDLWYWDGDSIVPPQMGRYLASRIPTAVPHFLPGGGHFSLYSHWRDILTPLARAGG